MRCAEFLEIRGKRKDTVSALGASISKVVVAENYDEGALFRPPPNGIRADFWKRQTTETEGLRTRTVVVKARDCLALYYAPCVAV